MASIIFLHSDLLTIALRMVIASFLAGFIGLEREYKQHPAGLRTHLLVGVGACLMMTLSVYGIEKYVGMHENIRFDPARIPSYVISGIGFLGAGTIIVHGRKVRGLTTAASIWVVAGIGLVVGAGMYVEALLATLIVMFSLFLLTNIELFYVNKAKQRSLVVYGDEQLHLREINKTLAKFHIEVAKQRIDKIKKESALQKKYVFQCTYSKDEQMALTIEALIELEHVQKISHGQEL